MPFLPYRGERWLSSDELVAFCEGAAAAHPRWCRVLHVGTSRAGRPIVGLTLGDFSADPDAHPALWLDGGTHAGEWLGVMAVVWAATRWIEGLAAGDPALVEQFGRSTVHLVPCISPDGYQALRDGAPFLRSTVRPPRDGRPRVGLDPEDLDGDGRVRWMRWRHPTGPVVFDDPTTAKMRPRRLDDDPADAWWVATEGRFVAWDGHQWTMAGLRHGLDLNRNFPGSWQPFEMFGMDGGDVALSEPESRAVVDTFRARRRIAAGLTNHTYTGALLTQPYRADTPLAEADVTLMETMGRQLVDGTGWRCLRTFPDFTYNPKKPIVGVWSDTMSTVFGVPGYTLELWDPFAFAGTDNPDPGKFWTVPDPVRCAKLVDAFAGEADAVAPWVPYDHPQLGPVELGGFDLVRTLHNPPVRLLAEECAKGFTVADRLRRALPQVAVEVRVDRLADGLCQVSALLENRGFLPTSGLPYAERIGTAPPIVLEVHAPVVDGEARREVGWLDGWGVEVGDAHPLYPELPRGRSARALVRWLVRAEGPVQVSWDAGRGGSGQTSAG